MSRYIDADAIIEAIGKNKDEKETLFNAVMTIFTRILTDAPSIDIVRCKECKHNPWNTDADYTCIWDDDFADREQTPDDFCSYGERRVNR